MSSLFNISKQKEYNDSLLAFSTRADLLPLGWIMFYYWLTLHIPPIGEHTTLLIQPRLVQIRVEYTIARIHSQALYLRLP